MFGKKTTINQPAPAISGHIQTIPEVFYAGSDPIIYHQKEPVPNLELKKPVVSSQPLRKPTISLPEKRKKHLWIIGGFIFLVCLAGTSWFFVNQEKKKLAAGTDTPIIPTTPTAPESVSETVTPTDPIVVTTTPSEEKTVTSTPTSTALTQSLALTFPSKILIDTPDFDADQLTDQEEELFRTDGSVWDTDGDGYFDGQEVLNLYNPAGTAPEKIVDSGLVREFVSPIWQYRVYYPAIWEEGVVDQDSRQVLLSSITGDYVEIRVIDKSPVETFATWFAIHAAGENISDIRPITNRFQEEGYERTDGLVGYFVESDRVYVIVYHPSANASNIPFRHVVKMMIQSFRPSRLPGNLPSQPVLPTASAPVGSSSSTVSTSFSSPSATSSFSEPLTSTTSINMDTPEQVEQGE